MDDAHGTAASDMIVEELIRGIPRFNYTTPHEVEGYVVRKLGATGSPELVALKQVVLDKFEVRLREWHDGLEQPVLIPTLIEERWLASAA